MTSIHKIAEITRLSLRTLRTVEKHGFLLVTKSGDPFTDGARANLKKGNRLTAFQQLHLLRNPDARRSLAAWEAEIDDTLAELGNAIGEGAPWAVALRIPLAAKRDKAAIEIVATWFRDLIMASDSFGAGRQRDHAFLAARLMANVPEYQIEEVAPKLTACMWQARNHPAMSGLWSIIDKRTIYRRPKVDAFDL